MATLSSPLRPDAGLPYVLCVCKTVHLYDMRSIRGVHPPKHGVILPTTNAHPPFPSFPFHSLLPSFPFSPLTFHLTYCLGAAWYNQPQLTEIYVNFECTLKPMLCFVRKAFAQECGNH